jgi:hypothetical protein
MEKLQDYTLTELNMQSIIKTQLVKLPTCKQEQQQKEKEKEQRKHDAIKATSFFEPKEVDSLFWIAFVILHGQDEYNNTNHRKELVSTSIG